MNTLEIPQKKILKEYPSCWDEHTPEQHLFVMQQILKLEDGLINMNDFKIIVLYKFLDIKYNAMASAREKRLSGDDLLEKYRNTAELMDTLDYFFKLEENEKGKQYVIDYNTTRNFVEYIDIGNTRYYGPADTFQNLVFIEIIDSLNHYRNFISTHNHEYLDKLIAVLYRPEIEDYPNRRNAADFDGERRIKYNRATNDFRAKEISKIPFYLKFTILWYWTACWQFITSETISVNNVDINLKLLFDSGKTETNKKDLGFIGVLFKLSETGILGNIDELSYRNIYDVLALLYQQKIEYDEMKRKMANYDKNKKV